MAAQFGRDMERRVEGLLAKVPGYRGYRAKEDRRDADRRVREHVVAAVDAEVDRVERVARELAGQRRLADVGPVDEFARTLRHFIDRVGTATYGYGGLFSDRNVDEAALDQLREFDEGLLAGVDTVREPVAALETAFASGGDVASPARGGATAARALLARFDLRGEVIETGRPAPADSVLRVLGRSEPAKPHPTYDLHEGDAVAILGENYVVDARIAVEGSEQAFRLFHLGSGEDQWLFVPQKAGAALALLRPATEAVISGAETVIGGAPYITQSTGAGDGDVIGAGGRSGARGVRFTLLAGTADPTTTAVVLDWGHEQQVFAGKEVHPGDLEIFGR